MNPRRGREVLQHLCLSGVDAIQILSPRMKNYERMALSEVQDAVTTYDEMLAFRNFLDNGEILNCDVMPAQSE